MYKSLIMAAAIMFAPATINAQDDVNIGKNKISLASDRLTPEALWAMGRIGSTDASPDGRRVVYTVAYYSVKENKGHHVIYVMDADGKNNRRLTTSSKNETDPVWIDGGRRIAFLTGGQIWTMDINGSDRRQMTRDKSDIEGFKFSPDGKKVILIKSMPFHEIIKENPSDLPKATGRRVTDLAYRHWDHYVESIQHPFVADVTSMGITEGKDILEGEPFECPMEPFGGVEQLDWSKDSKKIAYTCRKKTGRDYAISTDSDIFLYDIETGTTTNLCKPADYVAPEVDPSKTLKNQAVNAPNNLKNNVGYDQNPQFSPDGRYIAWLSMERDGYEADRNRLCIYDLKTATKNYVTERFDSNVDDFVWNSDSKTLYFIGCWHAKVNLYQTNFKGEHRQLTDDVMDFGSIQSMGDGRRLLMKRHSMSQADEIYAVTPGKNIQTTKIEQLTEENKHIYDQLSLGTIEEHWVTTTDGLKEQVWIILPPHFDPNKKYPTLLYCEGGPQSPVSQFWSYRWNFQIMAAHDYVIVAPNRRGLPGYGQAWNEAISSDWTGQCMRDYLSAIDYAVENLPYVDKNRLGAVGASFGGFSVYYLAGHHDKRFKCFIAHDGAFNLESMYTDTEEVWFSNWEYDDAYWNKDQTAAAKRTYDYSPHKWVDKWDTPILCIHGEMDYRINGNQGMGAFNAARLKGIEAELLIFPDENHWVLKPQNGILWQRTFFNWLDRWLKK